MGADTKIEWAHHTFNPWMGCTKVSQGCAHCYAEQLMDTRWGKVEWGPNGTRVRTSQASWDRVYSWDRAAEKAGVRHRVFCASLADVFEDRVDLYTHRRDLWRLIHRTPNLDWLLLTKRPENVSRFVPEGWIGDWPANVWMGTTVENEEMAKERIPILSRIPARIRFLSCEPLLTWIDISRWLGDFEKWNSPIHWVIAGGESGPKARPAHPFWFRHLRDQCQIHGVHFFFKQWGEYVPIKNPDEIEEPKIVRMDLRGRDVTDLAGLWDERDIFLRRVGKKSAGRMLDGRDWNEVPA